MIKQRRGAITLAILGLVALAAQGSPDQAQQEREAQRKAFCESLSGVQLVGYFTDSNLPEDAPLSKDKYTLSKVAHFKDDTFRFDCRIEYGGRDVTLPLLLEVKWAGDTPVITLTDMPVPGLGKFTSRVLIYRNEYAGTWAGGTHGGQMFGRIEKLPEDPESEGADKEGG